MDVATQVVTMRAAATQQLAQVAIAKKQHQMEMNLVSMLAEVAKAAPPPGQGLAVDKSA